MRRYYKFALVVLLVSSSCSLKKEREPSGIFADGQNLVQLQNKELEELSGLVASRAHPGKLWTHNDSGNAPVVYLIDSMLQIQLRCTLKGIVNRDWEDISIGPGPVEGKVYVYVADIGDNRAVTPVKTIYRFEEPANFIPGKDTVISNFDTLTFKLPDGPKDTEAFMVHPATGDFYIISKREEPVHVYRLTAPGSSADTAMATDIGIIAASQITAADFSPDGQELLVKNYERIFYWPVPQGKDIPEVLKERPLKIPYKREPQGEAIAFTIDGSGFYTVSEKVKGEKSHLRFFRRNPIDGSGE